jgi:hypothetical protein
MKLYIDNYKYNPTKINLSILKNKFKHDKTTFVEFYTDNGIYIADKNDLYKLIPTDKPLETTLIHGLNFIIDESYYTKKQTYQLSPEHVIIKKMFYVFYNSKVKMMVEGDVTTNEDEFVPSNFYFETHSSNHLDDKMILNEFNEFLSSFN